MPESGEHDLFGVRVPMVTIQDLAFAFRICLRSLGEHPNLAEARWVTTKVQSFIRAFPDEELELIAAAIPSGEMFLAVRDVVRLEQERRTTLGK